ncbi:MAG: Carboxypeptidase regulatory-like domain [Acidobacteriota bacterium]|jgi:hypothetical protein|nr:Carboxypeptidase regulatory-like domain [Acidobacteriota bacterium]
MSESIESSPAQNSKVLIITAIITAMTTIGVSFVGVVPQLRGHDTGTISDLQKELKTLKESVSVPPPVIPSSKRLYIDGSVKSLTGKPLNGIDVFLLPDAKAEFSTKTDDSGRFSFADIPNGRYSIIVRESKGMSGTTHLWEGESSAKVLLGSVQYSIKQKGDANEK